MSQVPTSLIKRAAAIIAQAECLLITAGAGMSVDSGLPDYRGNEGFWNHYPVYRHLRADYAAMTRPSGFARDAHFAWGFYGHCLNLYRAAQPHAGYDILKQRACHLPDGGFVLTSNVDGLFLKSGVPKDQVRECHGSVHRLQCLHPCRRITWPADGIEVSVDPQSMRARDPLPTCPHCGGVARPAVFAFGDVTYVWEDTQAQAERYAKWRAGIQGRRLVVIECGSGPTVPGLRREGEEVARSYGGRLIRINLRDAEVEHPDDLGIPLPVAPALTLIQETLQA